jgi:N-methylhydantoinase B
MYLARAGQMNEDLLDVVRANVREPVQVVGDIYGLAACNDTGSKRLIEMMEEFALATSRSSRDIIGRSRQAMIEAIAKLPRGSWSASMTVDGFEAPVELVGRLTIEADVIKVDYTGTSGSRVTPSTARSATPTPTRPSA